VHPGGAAVPDDETLQRAAEHKAAALHNLGWETGAGATIWARAITDLLEQHEGVRDGTGQRIALEEWERLHSTALLLVVAIDQVLTFARRVCKLTGDAELAKARDRFDAVGPRAEAIRDLVVHLDEYAIGAGRRQTEKAEPPISDPYLRTQVYWGVADDGARQGTMLNLGDENLDLRTAGKAAVALAEVVERVRRRHLERVSAEANEAFRRRWGVDEA
jgi:hypothetical protein